MISNKINSKIPIEYVFYKRLHLPQKFGNTPGFTKKLRESVILQAQGSSVELSENVDLPTLMIAFSIVRKVSQEAILVLRSGEKILLFDHHSTAVLRPKDINTEFVSKLVIEDEHLKKSLIINIEALWRQISKKNKGNPLRSTIDRIQEMITNSEYTTLVGKNPKVLFLLTQYIIYPFSKEIRYQHDDKSQPLVI